MSQDNVAVIQGIYDAFSTGDIPGVLGRMSPGIVWNEAENFPYADGNPYVGPEAVANGRAMRAQVVHVWTLADGKAVAFQQYADTLQVARVTGAA